MRNGIVEQVVVNLGAHFLKGPVRVLGRRLAFPIFPGQNDKANEEPGELEAAT